LLWVFASTLKHENKASLVCTHPMTFVSVIALAILLLLHWKLFKVVLLIPILSMDDYPTGVAIINAIAFYL
jgi:hypothetical protein